MLSPSRPENASISHPIGSSGRRLATSVPITAKGTTTIAFSPYSANVS
ncbi:MAG: hypothetical protein ACLP8S_12025 [Solirubrobacteraceae bacterium]